MEGIVGKLEGKVAVVTGGSSGIGLAIAKLFIDEGAYVFITGRRAAELEKAKADLGPKVTTVQGDVANLDDLDTLYRTVAEVKGGLDIIVANAGHVEEIGLADATPEHFDATFSVNARGTFFTVQKAGPLLRDHGAIVLIGSHGHLRGRWMYTTYFASKAAVRSFARTWADEFKGRQIRVNCLSPGPIETPIINQTMGDGAEARRAYFARTVPLGRMGLPEECASVALFLASADSSYMTGCDLVVDGGFTQLA
jgi:NAD(P)-dependent dehydrogenase (short-subunit alcohol dehydrogenase family)